VVGKKKRKSHYARGKTYGIKGALDSHPWKKKRKKDVHVRMTWAIYFTENGTRKERKDRRYQTKARQITRGGKAVESQKRNVGIRKSGKAGCNLEKRSGHHCRRSRGKQQH